MTATFLVEVTVPDSDLLLYAADIEDDLLQTGHEVLSVKPWAREGVQPLGQLPPSLPGPLS